MPFREKKRIRGASRPLFLRPIGERRAVWPRLQARCMWIPFWRKFGSKEAHAPFLPDQWLNRGWRGPASNRVLILVFAYTLLPRSIKRRARGGSRSFVLSFVFCLVGWVEVCLPRGTRLVKSVPPSSSPELGRRGTRGARSGGRGASRGVEQGRGGGLRGESSPESVRSRDPASGTERLPFPSPHPDHQQFPHPR